MKVDKYYTPTLNEFHVNFSYEVYYNNEWVQKNNYSNAYDYEDDCLYGLIKDLEKGLIRVKYLDKPDIESLGFEVGESCYGKRGYRLVYREEDHFLCTMRYSSVDSNNILFQGTIKNKPELIKLMKQTGIE